MDTLLQAVMNLLYLVLSSLSLPECFFLSIKTKSQNIEDKNDLVLQEKSGTAMLKTLRINKLVGMFIQELL